MKVLIGTKNQGKIREILKICENEMPELEVITLNDVNKLDEEFKKRKTVQPTNQKPSYKKGSFYQFEQRDYDFDALEKQLVSN